MNERKPWFSDLAQRLNKICNLCKLQSFIVVLILFIFSSHLSPRRKTPNIFLTGLTYDQIFKKNSSRVFWKSLSNLHIGVGVPVDQILVECRNLKKFFRIDQNRKIVIFISLFCFRRNISKKSYWPMMICIIKRFSKIYETDKKIDFRAAFKVLESEIWRVMGEKLSKTHIYTTNSVSVNLSGVIKNNVMNCQKSTMLWYSTNIEIITKKDETPSYPWNIKELNYYLTEHLVWNEDQKQFMERLGFKNVKAVGPILFETNQQRNQTVDDLAIIYYDVAPLKAATRYHNFEVCKLTIEEIVQATEEINAQFGTRILVTLKPKRRYHPGLDERYLDLLKYLSKHKRIKLLSYRVNLFDSMSGNVVVLGTPYTSPVVLANTLKIPSAFFAVDCVNWDIPINKNGIMILKSREDLKKLLVNLFSLV